VAGSTREITPVTSTGVRGVRGAGGGAGVATMTLGDGVAATPGTTSVQPGWTSASDTTRPSTVRREPGSRRTVRPSVK